MILKPDTGIDASHWQRGVKIANLFPLPRFAIFKATEGTSYKDDTTVDFADQTRALGIPLGFYHFWNNSNAAQQANNYLDQVSLAGGFERIPPVLDLEVDLTGRSTGVKTWLDIVESMSGIRPILYGNKGIFDKLGNPSWFRDYDIWSAFYPNYPDYYDWIPPYYSETRGRREIMWQYASTYRYPAYPAIKIDTNIAIPEFLQEIGVVTTPPQGNQMKKGILTPATSSLRIRSGNNSDFPQIGGIYPNDVVYGELDTVSGWLHIQWIDRASETIETINGWCSGHPTYITLTDYVPPSSSHTVDVYIDGVLEYHKDLP